jgi:3-hydroxyacyl-[acyl-carrier-protein] dehydratase
VNEASTRHELVRAADPGIDHADIRALLPQGHPNVLVDRVVRCEPGMMIETVKAVSSAEPCYAHLPDGLPADGYHYPEALLLEAFTQSAALLWARTRARPFAGMPVLAGTRGVTFHHPVGPGSLLRTVVKLIPGTTSTMFFCGRSSLVDGPLVLTVDNLVLAIRRPNAVLRAAGE